VREPTQHTDLYLLENREKFAVRLRKQKKEHILNQHRWKLDIHPLSEPNKNYNLAYLDNLCSEVLEAIRSDTDILPPLTELRRFFST